MDRSTKSNILPPKSYRERRRPPALTRRGTPRKALELMKWRHVEKARNRWRPDSRYLRPGLFGTPDAVGRLAHMQEGSTRRLSDSCCNMIVSLFDDYNCTVSNCNWFTGVHRLAAHTPTALQVLQVRLSDCIIGTTSHTQFDDYSGQATGNQLQKCSASQQTDTRTSQAICISNGS